MAETADSQLSFNLSYILAVRTQKDPNADANAPLHLVGGRPDGLSRILGYHNASLLVHLL